MNILSVVDGDDGFFNEINLSVNELSVLRSEIHSQWHKRIVDTYPELKIVLNNYDLNRYHLLLNDYKYIDHNKLWGKENRIFHPDVTEQIKEMDFYKKLQESLGQISIANEEEMYPEEIYWRLTRPGHQEDVGPVHADSWFWELGHGRMLEGCRRIKIWIPIYSEPGRHGFKFLPGSHKKSWLYSGVKVGDMLKPMIDENQDIPDLLPYSGQDGNAIIFHDNLLHGGLVGGRQTRVSVEWTIFVKNIENN